MYLYVLTDIERFVKKVLSGYVAFCQKTGKLNPAL